ncbi:MAG: type I 3-dehydroquinate dehydratase [Candidatus Poseidoniaceae archaeon]|jgi:3-dehydroquinate dehydratase type I|tara:strand:- start:1227 stop:2024 length:798 start_codon:yes stop_codon:yes gene_type:complete
MADPLVCVSLEGTTVKEMLDEAARAGIAGADMIEVRFDRLYLSRPEPTVTENEEGEITKTMPPASEWPVRDFADIDVETSITSLKEGIPLPVIFAARPVREGGHFSGDEDQRINVLEQGIASGATWIDLEISIDADTRAKLMKAAKAASCKIIASIHDTDSTPSAEEIQNLLKTNAEMGDLVKFCGTVNDHQDALQIVEATHAMVNEKVDFAAMALGNGGDWARLHAPVLNQTLVYASMRNEFRLSDKGLVNVRDLREAWNLLEY